jgi:hypothetical protein
MKTRYKIRKEQLERVVESFVMESTKTISESDMKMVNLISEKYKIDKKDVIKEMKLIKEYDEKSWMDKFHKYIKVGLPKLNIELTKDMYDNIVKQAKADDFEGDYKVVKNELIYVPSSEVGGKSANLPWWKRIGKGTGSST